MDIFYIYLVAGVIAVVIGYACMRWIDFGFRKVEDKRRCKMAKAVVRCYNDGQKQMATSMIRGINDNLLEMYKKFGDL